jgi:hypothetical protein
VAKTDYTTLWPTFDSVKSWWESFTNIQGVRHKTLASLIILRFWVIWNESNISVSFCNITSMPITVFSKIKIEAALWIRADAKHLGEIMQRDCALLFASIRVCVVKIHKALSYLMRLGKA